MEIGPRSGFGGPQPTLVFNPTTEPKRQKLRLHLDVNATDRDQAAELFMTAAAGMPAEFVAGIRQSPYWAPVEEIAHTISYDGRIMGTTMSGNPLPADRWATIDVPVLVMHGDKTAPWLISGAEAMAAHLRTATLKPVPGENHSTEPSVLAPVLRQFAHEV